MLFVLFFTLRSTMRTRWGRFINVFSSVSIHLFNWDEFLDLLENMGSRSNGTIKVRVLVCSLVIGGGGCCLGRFSQSGSQWSKEGCQHRTRGVR